MWPLIPSNLLYTLAVLAGISCALGIVRVGNLTRSSMLTMFRGGLACLIASFLSFGIIQFMFQNPDQIEQRTAWSRTALAYQFILVIIWITILHLKGKKL